MKRIVSLMMILVVCLMTGTAFAQEEGFVLRQSDYMRSLGYEDVVLDAQPERVACMSSYPFEALYALGVPMVCVAKTSTITYPEDLTAKVLTAVTSAEFSLEAIVALEPDLVFLPDSAMATHGTALMELGYPVYAVTTKEPDKSTYEVVKQQTEFFIEAFGTEENAEAAQAMRDSFSAVEARAALARERYAGKTFFGATCVSNTDFYLQAQTSTISSLMKMLGFENVYSEQMGATTAPVDLESLAGVEADLFVFTTSLPDIESARVLCQEAIAANPEFWQAVPAVERGDVLYLPARYVVTAGLHVIDNMNELIDLCDQLYAEE